jgi:hypothetical protein
MVTLGSVGGNAQGREFAIGHGAALSTRAVCEALPLGTDYPSGAGKFLTRGAGGIQSTLRTMEARAM